MSNLDFFQMFDEFEEGFKRIVSFLDNLLKSDDNEVAVPFRQYQLF